MQSTSAVMRREEWAQRARQSRPWLFDLADRFAEAANQLLGETSIGVQESMAAIRALLFSRVVCGTEALVTLAQSGFLTEADVIYRSNLEALFRLAALVESPQMLIQYLGEDHPRRRRAIGDIRKLRDSGNSLGISDAQLDEAERKFDREAEEFRRIHNIQKLRELSTWDWVQAGKQFDFFHGKYLKHSNVAHHAQRDLERRITERADGNGIESISVGIEGGSPAEIVLEALLLLVRAIDVFAKAVAKDISADLWALRRELDDQFSKHVAKADTE